MKMQSHSEIEERDLKSLLETFASAFSLRDIASAYCQAKSNVDLAGEILSESYGIIATSAFNKVKDTNEPSNLPLSVSGVSAAPAKISCPDEPPQSFLGQRDSRSVKSKVCPASLGTVSGIVGREYIQPKTTKKQYPEVAKPLKLDGKELPESEIWGEEPSLSKTAARGPVDNDVVEFLFKMLGDGFELDKNEIQEVLGRCGYDAQKTMEKLLDMSASTLEKCDDVLGLAGENSGEQYSEVTSASSEKAGTVVRNSTDSPKRGKDRFGLQKEVLEALFSVPERSEEKPKRIRLVRARPYSKPVVKSSQYTSTDQQTAVVEAQVVKDENDIDDENSYKVLRRAAREHWLTMKEYYRAAVDAFAKGDYARADKLLKEGQFFDQKAREADEKSAQKLLETNASEDDMSLDLREHEKRDALRLLRLHLTSLSGIPTIKYLRVIVGTADEDTTDGARKRLITKQLEKDSIKWTEEENGRTIRIQLDVIDPKSLSFWKKN